MIKNKKKVLTDCLIDNDDYFYRDNEMARNNLDNINHQIDETFKKEKKQNSFFFLFFI